MAEEEKEQAENSDQDPLDLLEAKAKGQFNLIVAAGITTFLLIACAGYTYVSLSGRISVVTQEPLMEMTNLAGLVGEEYESLNLAVEFHNHLMETIGERLDGIDPSIDQQKFTELEDLLLDQEKDFQYFLETSKIAVYGLAEMMSGSRGWREDFSTKLDAAIATSKQRELNLSVSPEGRPEDSDSITDDEELDGELIVASP
jgi:hypothetical protein